MAHVTRFQSLSTVEIVIVERKKMTFILCFFECKTITTCDIENLAAQIHGLYNCHQVVKKYMVCHVLPLSFSVTPVLSTEFSYLSSSGIADQDDYWDVA